MRAFRQTFRTIIKNVLISLGLTAATSETDTAIHKKMFRCSRFTLIISIEEMIAVMKIFKFLEESGLLIKSVSKKINNEAKGKKGGFLRILLGTSGATLLGNL